MNGFALAAGEDDKADSFLCKAGHDARSSVLDQIVVNGEHV